MTKFAMVDNLETEEARKLWEEAQTYYEGTILLKDLSKLLVLLEKDHAPKILYDNVDISDTDIIMVRSSRHHKAAKAVLVRVFENLGANIIDPTERFPVGFASKLLTSISKHKKGCSVSTYLSFSHQSTLNLISYLETDQKLFIKPINGSQSRNVWTLNTLEAFRSYSSNFSYSYREDIIPLFIQKFINIDKEYRMFVVNGKIIASMKKIRKANGNISYKRMRFARMAEFVIEHVSKTGILGVDVCQDIGGNFFIIEANRGPMFHYLEDKTGINISREIFNNLGNR
uniref:ATP-grasp fold RimK-type domain-containing protein n=1 Tax=viral metagenome TaxID=1070528 RepID=A0A6H2A479_9ZZZZ